jgi:hypothetical protein
MFDRDLMDRGCHGVTRHWLYQDADDPTHNMLSLEFLSTEKARVFLSALWGMAGVIIWFSYVSSSSIAPQFR